MPSSLSMKESSDHVEDSKYPMAQLSDMPSPPSISLLKSAEALAAEERNTTVFASMRREWRVLGACFVYLLACMAQGADSGSMNTSNAMPAFLMEFGTFDPATKQAAIPSVWLSLWTAMISLGNAVGTLFVGVVNDRVGSRNTTWLLCLLSIAFIAIQVTSHSRGQLLAGKMLNGIPQGAFIPVAASYLSEVSGLKVRPVVMSGIPLFILSGITMTVGLGLRFIFHMDPWKSYRLIFAIQWLFPALVGILLVLTPESPVYLVKKGRIEAARSALRRLHGNDHIDERVALVQLSVAAEQAMLSKTADASYLDCFRGTDRKRTLTIIFLFAAYQFSGIALLSNGLYFLQLLGLQIQTVFNLSLGFLGLSAAVNFLGPPLMQTVGRRGLFVWGNVGQGIILVILGGLHYTTSSAGLWVVAILFNLAISTAQVTTGAPSYTLAVEISSIRLRAKQQALGICSYFVWGWITAFITPYMFQATSADWGVRTSWFYAGLTFLSVLVAYFYVPETKGLSYLDIDEMYNTKVSPRHFQAAQREKGVKYEA